MFHNPHYGNVIKNFKYTKIKSGKMVEFATLILTLSDYEGFHGRLKLK